MLGLPLQVAHIHEPIDFVLNAVAGYRIVEMDDCNSRIIRAVSRHEGASKLSGNTDADVDADEESNNWTQSIERAPLTLLDISLTGSA